MFQRPSRAARGPRPRAGEVRLPEGTQTPGASDPGPGLGRGGRVGATSNRSQRTAGTQVPPNLQLQDEAPGTKLREKGLEGLGADLGGGGDTHTRAYAHTRAAAEETARLTPRDAARRRLPRGRPVPALTRPWVERDWELLERAHGGDGRGTPARWAGGRWRGVAGRVGSPGITQTSEDPDSGKRSPGQESCSAHSPPRPGQRRGTQKCGCRPADASSSGRPLATCPPPDAPQPQATCTVRLHWDQSPRTLTSARGCAGGGGGRRLRRTRPRLAASGCGGGRGCWKWSVWK